MKIRRRWMRRKKKWQKNMWKFISFCIYFPSFIQFWCSGGDGGSGIKKNLLSVSVRAGARARVMGRVYCVAVLSKPKHWAMEPSRNTWPKRKWTTNRKLVPFEWKDGTKKAKETNGMRVSRAHNTYCGGCCCCCFSCHRWCIQSSKQSQHTAAQCLHNVERAHHKL